MKLSLHVLGQEVAVLEPVDDFQSVLTYRPDTVPNRDRSIHLDFACIRWKQSDFATGI
jgi:hypothetical protein